MRRFFDGIERYTPTLVSWNGSGFDLPVLHYRALRHGVQAHRYWEMGDEDQAFRWNNYISRFHWRHVDLMDVLSGFQGRGRVGLDKMAQLLGLPGKLGMSGEGVWDAFLEGRIEDIRNYCETDVINTYLIYLRFELMRGRLTPEEHDRECALVRDWLGVPRPAASRRVPRGLDRRRRMKRISAAPEEADIVDLSHEGDGVARIDGKAVFVADALPGERVVLRRVAPPPQLRRGRARIGAASRARTAWRRRARTTAPAAAARCSTSRRPRSSRSSRRSCSRTSRASAASSRSACSSR